MEKIASELGQLMEHLDQYKPVREAYALVREKQMSAMLMCVCSYNHKELII